MHKRSFEALKARDRASHYAHEAAVRRRYAGAMTTKRSVEALIARRDISHRTACLCPDQRRQHTDTPCPHLPRRG
jgi:hypothetical protein